MHQLQQGEKVPAGVCNIFVQTSDLQAVVSESKDCDRLRHYLTLGLWSTCTAKISSLHFSWSSFSLFYGSTVASPCCLWQASLPLSLNCPSRGYLFLKVLVKGLPADYHFFTLFLSLSSLYVFNFVSFICYFVKSLFSGCYVRLMKVV